MHFTISEFSKVQITENYWTNFANCQWSSAGNSQLHFEVHNLTDNYVMKLASS